MDPVLNTIFLSIVSNVGGWHHEVKKPWSLGGFVVSNWTEATIKTTGKLHCVCTFIEFTEIFAPWFAIHHWSQRGMMVFIQSYCFNCLLEHSLIIRFSSIMLFLNGLSSKMLKAGFNLKPWLEPPSQSLRQKMANSLWMDQSSMWKILISGQRMVLFTF